MARSLRLEYPGAIYHVTSRMVGSWRSERGLLFREDDDRLRFLDQLAERVQQRNIRLFLFCLMSNHIHLVFETPQANCSAFMQGLLTAYTVYHNRRHQRHGHLFDGRYHARLVDGDDYLLSLTRYVHLNPVKVKAMKQLALAERVKRLRAYRWSSYPSYIGRRKPPPFVTYGPVLRMVSGRAKERPRRYRQFVEAGLAETDEEFEALLDASPRCIGGETFRGWVEQLHEAKLGTRGAREDVSFRRTTERMDPEVVLRVVADVLGQEVSAFRRRQRDSSLRALAASFLIEYSGRSQREVAAVLDAGSGAAISKQLSRFAEKNRDSKEMRKVMKQIRGRLDALRAGSQPRATKS